MVKLWANKRKFVRFLVFFVLFLLFLVKHDAAMKWDALSGTEKYYGFTNQQIYVGTSVAQAPVGELVEGTVIEQTIPIGARTDGVSLLFATYARTNTGKVSVKMQGETSQLDYGSYILDADKMADNSFIDFKLERQPAENGDKALRVTVTADGRTGNAVTLWTTVEDTVPEYPALKNGEALTGDVIYKTWMTADTVAKLNMDGPFIVVLYALLAFALAVVADFACAVIFAGGARSQLMEALSGAGSVLRVFPPAHALPESGFLGVGRMRNLRFGNVCESGVALVP